MAKAFEVRVSSEGRCAIRRVDNGKCVFMQPGRLVVGAWTESAAATYTGVDAAEPALIKAAQAFARHAMLAGATDEALVFLRYIIGIRSKDLATIKSRDGVKPNRAPDQE